jgi:methionyl-tRNA formyltransferase
LNNNESAIKQDLSQRSYHDKEIPYGGKINFGWSAQKIYNFIRAFDFWPYVSSIGRPFIFYEENIINVLKAGVSEIHHSGEKPVGTILEFLEDSVLVNTASNTILIKSVLERKQMVLAVDYFKKTDMSVGDILL